ncbi:hypothetical protein [Kitasatospora sp. NPDC050463]|uniref:hypothetical protein n=1 Tax=Kitasatospora sp. NPDC050463 TaxID=3155786 RepID=UPI0033CBD797
MTNDHNRGKSGAATPVIERNFPSCRCERCDDTVPGVGLGGSSLLPVAPPPVLRAVPPAVACRPSRRGDAVFDVRSGRWGAFMAFRHGLAFLRPFGGGVEWDTEPRWLAQQASPVPAATS